MKKLLVVVCALVLASCGGGGGVESVQQPPAPVGVVKDPSGIWRGTIHYGTSANASIQGLITESGEGRLLTSTGYHAFGWGKTSQENWDSDGDGIWTFDFTVNDSLLPNSTFTTEGTFTLEVLERWHIDGDWQVDHKLPSFGDSGRISMGYSAFLYERPSSISLLEGLWGDGHEGIVTINADGSFFMQDHDGCVFNGAIEVVDPQYNGYRLSMEVSLCGANYIGFYQGLGFLDGDQTHVMGDLFDVQMDNGIVSFIPLFERL